MAVKTPPPPSEEIDYPTTDGKPMAETDVHRNNMLETISGLDLWFETDPNVYVSGNNLLYYVRGDKRKHISPDVYVVKGIPKRLRDYYLLWLEGKGPDCVIEMTSKSTKKQDLEKKFELYRDLLRVQEYFLFDPHAEYLKPPLQGYRLFAGEYARIEPVAGRLPSEVTGLHLEQSGSYLRLYDPRTAKWLPTPKEFVQAAREAEAARQKAEGELDQLRRELTELRQQKTDSK